MKSISSYLPFAFGSDKLFKYHVIITEIKGIDDRFK